MSQIQRKWIENNAVNNEKIDNSDIYSIIGLRVDSTNAVGRIGIGTTSPLDALHIRRPDSTAGIYLDSDGSSGRTYQLYSNSDGLLNVQDIDIGVDRLTLQSDTTSGRVGISTTTPLDELHARSF